MGLLPFSSAPIQATAVTPASYTNSNVTVNKYGQITAASNGSGGGTTININTQRIDQTPAGGTYGTLLGTVNGTNTIFTVSNGAYVSGTLEVNLTGSPQAQGSGNDWVETSPASGTFTFAVAPPTGSIVQAVYITQSTASGYQTLPLATVTGINAKTTGTTALYTVPAGKTAILTNAVVRCTAATAITNGPTASIGVTASSYSDIYASANIVALTTTSQAFGYSSVGMFAQALTTNVITLNITAAATGTSQTVSVDIMGYLI